MKTKIVSLALVLGLIAFLGACQQESTPPGGETSPAPGGSPTTSPTTSPS